MKTLGRTKSMGSRRRWIPASAVILFGVAIFFFYVGYVPLVGPFQTALVPLLAATCLLTIFSVSAGTLFFVFSFPLISNLPYFFGLTENIPHAPTALVLFVFFFLGWRINVLLGQAGSVPKQPVFAPMLFLAVLIVISTLISISRYTNFFPFLSDGYYPLLTNVFGIDAGGAIMSAVFASLSYLSGFAFFVILVQVQEKEGMTRKIIQALGAGALVSLLFGLYQHLANLKLGNNLNSIRLGFINATFKDALSFGAFLAVTTPLFLGASFAFKRIFRWIFLADVLLAVYLVFFTGSKGGLLGLLLALIVFLAAGMRSMTRQVKLFFLSPTKNRRRRLVAAALLVAFLVLAIIQFGAPFIEKIEASKSFGKVKVTLSRGNLGEMLHGRANYLWKLALLMIRDYPLTGVGIGGFIIEMSNYAKLYGIKTVTPESAENFFLQVCSEMGLPGLFLFLWIFWALFRRSASTCSQALPEAGRHLLVLGAISGGFAFLLIIQSHTFLASYEIQYIFWLLMAIIGAPAFKAGDEPVKVPDGRRARIRLQGSGPLITAALLVAAFAGGQLWNATHSLSLRSRTRQLGIKQKFGLYAPEITETGLEFQWTKRRAGFTIRVEKPVLIIPLLASHPDISRKPVRVRVYAVKDLFKESRLLDEIAIEDTAWRDYRFFLQENIDQDVLLLFKIDRTWNPEKACGARDPRNLGIAIGKTRFQKRPE